jgi:N-acetylmuramoyl-L-alanine amidase
MSGQTARICYTQPVSILVLLTCFWILFPPAMLAAPVNGSRSMGEYSSGIDTPVHKVKKKSSRSASTSVVIIQDVRMTAYPDHLRMVFDLQHPIAFSQHRQKASNQVLIKLHNVLLSKTAKDSLTDEALPQDVTIASSTQTAPQSVVVSLNLDTLSDYKLLPLNRPPRLVIDLYSKAPQEEETPRPAHIEPSPTNPPTPPQAKRAQQREIKTIVLDAGHGGKDPGAIGRGGTAEKHITLKISLLLRDLIAKHLGTQVIMTRDRDVFVELEDRAKFANRQDADLFVSIHVNSHPQRSTKGLEVYHFGEASDPRALAVAARENGTPIESTGVGWQYLVADLLTTKKMEESLELAWSTKEALVTHLNNHYDVTDHGVKTGPFYVLRFTSMPSILAEIAFISNSTEERLMQSDPFLIRIAEGIFEGIKAFIHPRQTASR